MPDVSAPDRAPAVSVVIATYNRSGVLRLAIESVRAQAFADWELWVIGDACTDDTAEVVASFADPRIRFVNLPENVGEQAGPNNAGIARARGRHVAFLNHDDLWFPDHLETMVAALEGTGADLVFARAAIYRPGQAAQVVGVAPTGRYDLTVAVPASLWLARRELLAELGGWRSAYVCHLAPSQDLLVRAHRAGKRLVPSPKLTTVIIPSGNRPGSYDRSGCEVQAEAWHAIRHDPGYRERVLEDGVTYLAARSLVPDPARTLARAGLQAWYWLLLRLGIHPVAARRALSGQKKGRLIDRLRRVRGLAPLDPAAAIRLTPSVPRPETPR